MMFAPEVQVKQYVAKVRGRFACFNVYRTGSDKHYLFRVLTPDGCEGGLEFPVLKKELKPEVRSMLAHGCGNTV